MAQESRCRSEYNLLYTRILRAVYNRAVEDDIIENRNPFRHVYTGVDKTVKRALPLAVIKKIKALDLSLTPALDYARDMFLMSFYLRGMSFIDMAFLKRLTLKRLYYLSTSQDRSATHHRMDQGDAMFSTSTPKTKATTCCPSSAIPDSTSDALTATLATISITV